MIKALVAMVGAAARTLGKATLVMQDSKNLPSAVPRRIAFVVWSDLFLRIHHTPALRTQQPWMQACAGAAKRRCQEAGPCCRGGPVIPADRSDMEILELGQRLWLLERRLQVVDADI